VDPDFLLRALLQHNYFPAQRRDRDELPPPLTTLGFTPEIAKQLIASKKRTDGGFDSVEYKLTRFNGVPRQLSLPHPTAQADLSYCIYQCWDKLEPLLKSSNSHVQLREHSDGRCIVKLQERLKLELFDEGITYVFKAGETVLNRDSGFDLDEAAVALACSAPDHALSVLAKRNLGMLVSRA